MLNSTTYIFLGEGGGGGKRGGGEKEQGEEEEKRRQNKTRRSAGCQLHIFPREGDNDQKNMPFGVFVFVCHKPLCHGWHLSTSCI